MYHVLLNPNAGRGRAFIQWQFLEKLFNENGIKYTTHINTKKTDGYERAKEFAHSECCGIIGIGGDGTLQKIVAGMFDADVKKPVPLGIFPAGSGNDFSMTLGNSYGKNAEQNARIFFETLMQGKTRTIDIITANGTAYLNIGNIGLDARIVKNASALKDKYGKHAYLAAVYKSILQHKNIPLMIEIYSGEAGSEQFENKYTLVAVCNGQYYGGGMRIAPKARIDDGKITLCLVKSIARPKAMILFPSILMQKHTHLKIVKIIECESVKITLPEGGETLCLDGNLRHCTGQIEFKIHPKALDVFV